MTKGIPAVYRQLVQNGKRVPLTRQVQPVHFTPVDLRVKKVQKKSKS